MQCRACGYMMTAFEKDCPRCAHLAQTQPMPPQQQPVPKPYAPLPPSMQMPAPPANLPGAYVPQPTPYTPPNAAPQVGGNVTKGLSAGAGVILAFIVVLALVFSSVRGKGPAHASAYSDLQLLEVHDETSVFHDIVGIVRNNSNHRYSNTQIRFSLFDASGNRVGTAFDVVDDIPPGGTWKFKAMITNHEAVRYNLASIRGD